MWILTILTIFTIFHRIVCFDAILGKFRNINRKFGFLTKFNIALVYLLLHLQTPMTKKPSVAVGDCLLENDLKLSTLVQQNQHYQQNLLIVMVISHFRVQLSPKVTEGILVIGVCKFSNKQNKAILNFVRKPKLRFIFPNFAKIASKQTIL